MQDVNIVKLKLQGLTEEGWEEVHSDEEISEIAKAALELLENPEQIAPPRFSKKKMKLKDLLPMLRSSGYDHRDESGTDIIIAPECEEWTHVKMNLNSGILDLLGELDVQNIDADEDDIVLWVETDRYNFFEQSRLYMEHYKRGREDEAGLRDGTIMQTFSPD